MKDAPLNSSLFDRRWICFTLLLSLGCGETEVTETSGSEPAVTETKAEVCRRKLAAGIRRVKPETLSMSSQPERAVNGLNSWIGSCEADTLESLKLSDNTIAMLPDSNLATARRFTSNDGSYIRNNIVLRKLGDSLTELVRQRNDKTVDDSVAVSLELFDWVINNVSLLPTDTQRPPLDLFDVLLLGEGTVADRVWAYATAMRQQRIDVFLVQTDAAANDESGLVNSASQLLVVLLPETSLVLDPLAGIPVYADATTRPGTASPLTGTDLASHKRWAESQLLIVGESPLYSPRMLVLQQQLAAVDSAMLYAELNGDLSDITPVTQRIADGFKGHWAKDSVVVWEYPDQQISAASSITEEQRRQYQELMKPFDAPFQTRTFSLPKNVELATVPEALSLAEQEELKQQQLMENFISMMDSDSIFGKASRLLLRARLAQLSGSQETSVIQQLQQVRTAAMVKDIRINVPAQVQKEQSLPPVITRDVPQFVKEVNSSAIGDAMFWAGESQMNRGEYGTAALAFNNYRVQFPEGRRRFASLVKEAMAMIQQDAVPAAIKLLNQANVDDNPELVRVRSWLTILESE